MIMTVFLVFQRKYLHDQYRLHVFTARTEEEAKQWIAQQNFECIYEQREMDLRPDYFESSSNCDDQRPHYESWQSAARRPTIWDMH